MIHVKAEIKGESDAAPFTRIFEYSNNSEVVFYNTLDMIKEKISKNMKINVNEALMVFCAHVVNELRAHKFKNSIEKNASEILKAHQVMIGVPETLKEITFEAIVDNLPKTVISFVKPIPTSNYMLVTNSQEKE